MLGCGGEDETVQIEDLGSKDTQDDGFKVGQERVVNVVIYRAASA